MRGNSPRAGTAHGSASGQAIRWPSLRVGTSQPTARRRLTTLPPGRASRWPRREPRPRGRTQVWSRSAFVESRRLWPGNHCGNPATARQPSRRSASCRRSTPTCLVTGIATSRSARRWSAVSNVAADGCIRRSSSTAGRWRLGASIEPARMPGSQSSRSRRSVGPSERASILREVISAASWISPSRYESGNRHHRRFLHVARVFLLPDSGARMGLPDSVKVR